MWVLYALDDGKPHSQKQIYEEWLIPKTTLNTIVKELESEGYVRMETISGQRREMHIYLTEAGKKYARQVLAAICLSLFFVVAEKSKLGLGITVFSGIANIILDALFVIVFQWGLAGAAVATAIAASSPLIRLFVGYDMQHFEVKNETCE